MIRPENGTRHNSLIPKWQNNKTKKRITIKKSPEENDARNN